MAQVTAQLEAARSVAFVPDNVSIADEQDEKDSSIWSDEDVEEQDELDEIEDAQDEVEDAQDDFKDVEPSWSLQWIPSTYHGYPCFVNVV